jgi:hypothetical protein
MGVGAESIAQMPIGVNLRLRTLKHIGFLASAEEFPLSASRKKDRASAAGWGLITSHLVSVLRPTMRVVPNGMSFRVTLEIPASPIHCLTSDSV